MEAFEKRLAELELKSITVDNFSAVADAWAEARATRIVVKGVAGIPRAAFNSAKALLGGLFPKKAAQPQPEAAAEASA